MPCDPCQFCQNCYDDSDPSVGLYGLGCDYDFEGYDYWEPDNGTPCPGFKPYLVSESLVYQLC